MQHLIQLTIATLASIAMLFGVSATLLPPTNDVAWVESLYALKSNNLSAIKESPRIIIVGGSEAHFSISAEQIEKNIGIKTLNFGTHAELGWDAHLYNVNKYVKEDDIIIFSGNYFSMQRDAPSELLSIFMRRNDIKFIGQQRLAYWPMYIGYNPIDYALRAVANTRSRQASIGAALKSNRYGDETRNIVVEGRNPYPPPMRYSGLPPKLNEVPQGIKRLAFYAKNWERRGIRTFVIWMAQRHRVEFSSRESKTKLKALENMANAWGLVQLNTPNEITFKDSEVADVPLHGNSIGRERYTRLLIERLKPYLDAAGQPANTGG